MVTIPQLTDRLKTFLGTQIEAVAKTNPMISFAKPLITRALDKNLSKINKTLELIADENGEIDVEAILSEMIESVMTTEPFTFKTPFNCELFKAWFGDNIDTKIIESAINFWFKDDDYKGGCKIWKYFKEA